MRVTGIEDPIPTRRCGRCLQQFPGDPSLHPTAMADWWLCPPCRVALLGDRPHRDSTAGGRADGADDAR